VIDSLCRGGAESMLAAILHQLAASGATANVVRAGRIEEADPQLVRSVAADAEQLAFLRSEHVYDPRFAIGLARVIRRCEIDVVHAHLAVASVNSRLAARALGRPHLTTIHTMPGSTLTDTRAWLIADAVTARLSQLHVAPSREVADASARHYRLDRGRFRVIPNAPATAAVRVADREGLRRQLFGAWATGPLVVCVARLVPGKGVDELIEAAAMLSGPFGDLHVAVAGAGPEHERLRAAIVRRGLEQRFRLLGHRPDVGRLLAAADVFCLPSRHEAAPISLLEAMDAGCACVASAVGAIPEMLDGGRGGLLVPPGEASALAAALARVLGDAALARSLGERAREAVRRRYSIEAVTAQYVELYRQLARG
jgi:glycosyltransferase involved in cell wall biosynthesis